MTIVYYPHCCKKDFYPNMTAGFSVGNPQIYRGTHTWSVQIDFCIYVHVHLSFYMVEGRVSTRSGMCCPCCLQSNTNMNRWQHRRTQLHSFHLKCAIKHLRRLVRSRPWLHFISCGCQMSVWAVRYGVSEQCIPVMTVSPS